MSNTNSFARLLTSNNASDKRGCSTHECTHTHTIPCLTASIPRQPVGQYRNVHFSTYCNKRRWMWQQ